MRECRRSEAEAIDGNSDFASVLGDNGFARAGISGNDDVATVFDPAATSSSAGSNAYAILGNDNFASVFGDGDYDRAGGTGGYLGSNDIATILGTDSTAFAGSTSSRRSSFRWVWPFEAALLRGQLHHPHRRRR
jgi:hypothetical protein